ncbi:hypothetical protein [Rosenbergiella nectarea]|uniref:hypothetical protein n=1 Tax=Rosenbergiella nectarea TaxID=988801 RepID=UPI001BD9C4FF|nr:hypothetical protein [Rosenbergiella nectarea]MBT0731012.1 hypothetical protein [Rosenbergiella nectarea subsp. apis]
MPKAVLKADELSDDLLDMLRSGVEINEFRFHSIIKEINSAITQYTPPPQTAYLKALANAVYGRRDAAIEHFESAMPYSYRVNDANFLAYLHDVGLLHKAVEIAEKISGKYVSSSIFLHAYEVNLILGRTNRALQYLDQYTKLADKKDADALKEKAGSIIGDSEIFKKNAGLNDKEFAQLSSLAVKCLELRGLKSEAMSFWENHVEGVNAFILSVKNDDPTLLCDLNFDIAMRMAEYDCFNGKNFSFWFETMKQEEHFVHAC